MWPLLQLKNSQPTIVMAANMTKRGPRGDHRGHDLGRGTILLGDGYPISETGLVHTVVT
jgi:hypothetical protein